MSSTAVLSRPAGYRPTTSRPLRGDGREIVRAELRGRVDDAVVATSSRVDAVAVATRAAAEFGRVVHCAVDTLGSVDELTAQLRAGGVSAVVVTGAADVASLVALTNHIHRYGARIVVEATEIIARQPFSIVSHGIDYVVCDTDALSGPSSGAVLIGRADWLTRAADVVGAGR